MSARRKTECRVGPLLRSWVLIAAVLSLTAACGGPRDRILGKWKAEESANAMVWEFSKNGVVEAGNTSGRYSFGDGSRLKIQTRSATFVYELQFEDDTMIWKEPNGTRTKLKRLP